MWMYDQVKELELKHVATRREAAIERIVGQMAMASPPVSRA